MTSSVGIQKHTLPRPDGLIECRTVLDVGAGIRPMQWYEPERHVCVEPYWPYCEVLLDAGYEIVHGGALDILNLVSCPGSDLTDRVEHITAHPCAFPAAVYILDVIEHLERRDAFAVLALARQIVATQVVIYTPLGFVDQTTDAWGMGGDYWQTHRSGWTPEDFPAADGWRTDMYIPEDADEPEGFFAVWTWTPS